MHEFRGNTAHIYVNNRAMSVKYSKTTVACKIYSLLGTGGICILGDTKEEEGYSAALFPSQKGWVFKGNM